MTQLPPIILLVRPQMGENIGAAARVMANFGLTELRIVAPRDGWPNPAAEAMSAFALPLLQRAEIFPDMASAVADCTRLYAATARERRLDKPAFDPATLSIRLHEAAEAGGRQAIAFGPERSGLENTELDLADGLLHIPTGADYPSLNLAQAVAVACYRWREAAGEMGKPAATMRELAEKSALTGLFQHLESALEQAGFFPTEALKPTMVANLRAMLLRAELSPQEVQSLRGVITALTRQHPPTKL